MYAAILRKAFYGALSPSTAGVTVSLADGPRILFLKLQYVLADLDAHRQSFDLKGSKGLKPCPFCPSVTAKDAALVDRAGRLVDITCDDRSRFGTTSSESIFETYDVVLAAQRRYRSGHLTKVRFESIEMASGFNANPHGIMASIELRAVFSPAETLTIDPMHVLWSNGIINEEIYLFMNCCPLSWAEWVMLGNIAWEWPGWMASNMKAGVRVFLSELFLEKNEAGKFFASELLSVYPLVRHVAELYFEQKDPNNAMFVSFARACAFADFVKRSKFHGLDPAERDALVSSHLRAFVAAYGREMVKPKHHFAYHVAELDCFATEAKHATMKRLASNIARICEFERAIPAVAQMEHERDLEEVQLTDGLVGHKAVWEGCLVADKVLLGTCTFAVKDIVTCGEVQGSWENTT